MNDKPDHFRQNNDFWIFGILVCAIIIAVIILTALAFDIPASPAVPGSAQEIRIGAIYNLNGSQSSLDIPSARGAELAAADLNRNGGVNGRNISLLVVDGRSDPDVIREAATKLINDDKVTVLIGMSDTDMVLPAARVAADAKHIFVTSGATSPLLPDQVPGYLFLAAFGDNAQAAAGAEFARTELNASRAFVVTDSSMEYTRLLSQYFSKRFISAGGSIVGNAGYDGTSGNYESVIVGTDISGQKPDVIFIACGPQDCGNVTRTIRAAGITAPVIGGDSMDSPALAEYAGQDAGNIFFMTHADIGNDSGDRNMAPFIAEYEQEFNETPTAFAALGYDTVNIVAEAARLSQSGDLRDGIWSIHGYDGLTGTYSYANRSFIPQKSVTIMELKNGTMISHGEWTPAVVPAP